MSLEPVSRVRVHAAIPCLTKFRQSNRKKLKFTQERSLSFAFRLGNVLARTVWQIKKVENLQFKIADFLIVKNDRLPVELLERFERFFSNPISILVESENFPISLPTRKD